MGLALDIMMVAVGKRTKIHENVSPLTGSAEGPGEDQGDRGEDREGKGCEGEGG